jgi:hypothetical protein
MPVTYQKTLKKVSVFVYANQYQKSTALAEIWTFELAPSAISSTSSEQNDNKTPSSGSF